MSLKFPKINQVILIIVFADFMLVTAFGFLTPVFSLFITQEITRGTVAVAGFALTIYWSVKSVLQLFVARYIDKNHGEYDDFYSMVIGGLISSVAVGFFYFATSVWHIYLLQTVLAVGDAFLVPPFYAIFTRHVDKGKEGFEWALYSSFSIGAGAALGGAFGGVLATIVGFRAVFPLVGLLAFVATIMLLFLRPYVLPKVPGHPVRVFVEKK